MDSSTAVDVVQREELVSELPAAGTHASILCESFFPQLPFPVLPVLKAPLAPKVRIFESPRLRPPMRTIARRHQSPATQMVTSTATAPTAVFASESEVMPADEMRK